jgi:hypothetical protein
MAMSEADWARFDALARTAAVQTQAPTMARAHGLVVSRLMETAAQARSAPGPLDWMDWERQKALRLIRPAI